MTVVTMASGTQFIVEETHAEAMQKLAAATNTGDLVVTAIALSMEALRKVDRRYGVSKRGEQYRGWRQLTSGSTPEDSIVTREQALAVLHHAAGVEPGHEDSIESLVRRAVRRTHPDVGGSEEEFRKVTKAREVLST